MYYLRDIFRGAKLARDVIDLDGIEPETVVSWFLDGKTIRDPIYDQIPLNELERSVIRTNEFQRLRHIKQMDFAYLVYPAAEHSRLTHSLGVCASLKILYDKLANKMFFYDDAEKMDAFQEGTEIHNEFFLANRVIVSVSALLHDIGHQPFSHAFDLRDDIPEHDDFSNNPFLGWVFFGAGGIYNSELAIVLEEWSKWYKFLLATEMAAMQPEDWKVRWERAENEQKIPSLASLVVETLALKPNKKYYKILCPIKEEDKENIKVDNKIRLLQPSEITEIAKKGWEQKNDRNFEKLKVKKSGLYRTAQSDLVVNTMSADLLEYIKRDTNLSGIKRSLDERFLAFIYPARYFGMTRVVIKLEDRQGHIRRDVLSELMNLMEMRYTVHERIVLHRTVISARSMAARIYNLSIEGDKEETKISKLYGKFNKIDHTLDFWTDTDLLKGRSEKITTSMGRLLSERKLYRPIVILDRERCQRVGFQLTESRKKILSEKCGNDEVGDPHDSPKKNSWKKVFDLEKKVNEDIIQSVKGWDKKAHIELTKTLNNLPLSIVTCMRGNVLFKDPKVLIQVPTSMAKGGNKIKELEEFISDILELSEFEIDEGTKEWLRSLLNRYKDLWRLYVFVHPVIFENEIFSIIACELEKRWLKEFSDAISVERIPRTMSHEDFGTKNVTKRQVNSFLVGDILWRVVNSVVAEKEIPFEGVIEFLHEIAKDDNDNIIKISNSLRDEEIENFKVAYKGETESTSPEAHLERFKSVIRKTIL